jgi:hypothetical protein
VVGRAVQVPAEARVIWRISTALAMLAAAAVLALFARDALHWQRALRDADARSRLGYVPPAAWRSDSTLPSGVVRRVLGIDDDLDFRRVISGALPQFSATPSLLRRSDGRAIAESALARLARDDADPKRAAIAADDLGALFYFDPPTPADAQNPYENPAASSPSGGETPTQKALSEFIEAARLDPSDAIAERNLETILRGTQQLPKTRIPRSGSGEHRGAKGSGSRAPGHGY